MTTLAEDMRALRQRIHRETGKSAKFQLLAKEILKLEKDAEKYRSDIGVVIPAAMVDTFERQSARR